MWSHILIYYKYLNIACTLDCNILARHYGITIWNYTCIVQHRHSVNDPCSQYVEKNILFFSPLSYPKINDFFIEIISQGLLWTRWVNIWKAKGKANDNTNIHMKYLSTRNLYYSFCCCCCCFSHDCIFFTVEFVDDILFWKMFLVCYHSLENKIERALNVYLQKKEKSLSDSYVYSFLKGHKLKRFIKKKSNVYQQFWKIFFLSFTFESFSFLFVVIFILFCFYWIINQFIEYTNYVHYPFKMFIEWNMVIDSKNI